MFCFGLGRAPRIFTKLLKIIPIALQGRVNICLMVYLYNMLIIGRTLEEMLMSWNTMIFFAFALGFYNKYQDISSGTNTENRVSGINYRYSENDSALIQVKLTRITGQCQDLLSQALTVVLILTKLIGLLLSTVQDVF